MPSNAPTGGFVAEYPLVRIDDFGTACPPLPPLVRAWAAQLEPRPAAGTSNSNSFGVSSSAPAPVVDLGDLAPGQTHFAPPSIYILTHAHMDHVPGLARCPPHAAAILCSPTTRRILIDHETARHRARAAADARVVSDRPFSSLSPAHAACSRRLRRERAKLLVAPGPSRGKDMGKMKATGKSPAKPPRGRSGIHSSRGGAQQRDQLVPIPVNTPTRVQYTPGVELVVTLVDANHMPGAVMVLIHGPRGAILHTGDVRAEAAMLTTLASNPFVSRWIRPAASTRMLGSIEHVPRLPADACAPTDADDNCWDQDHGDKEGALRAPQWARVSAEANAVRRVSQDSRAAAPLLHGMSVLANAAEGICRLGQEMADRSWKSRIKTLPLLGTTFSVEPVRAPRAAPSLRPRYRSSQLSDAGPSQLLSSQMPETDEAFGISARRLGGVARADWSTRLACIYIDTEAVERGAAAPPKAWAVAGLVDLLSLYPSSVGLYLHAWTWGYEEVLKGVARHFGEQIHMDPYRYHQYTVNAFESDPFLADILTLDPTVRIHACDQAQPCSSPARRPPRHCSSRESLHSVFVHPMQMSATQWRAYHALVRNQILAASRGDPAAQWPTLLHVPLGRHSALPELRALVALFEPDNVVPNSLPGTARRGGANPASVQSEELEPDVLTYWALPAMFAGTLSHLGQDRMVADAEAWMGPGNMHRARRYFEVWANETSVPPCRTPSPALAARFVRYILAHVRQVKEKPLPLPQPTASLTTPSAMPLADLSGPVDGAGPIAAPAEDARDREAVVDVSREGVDPICEEEAASTPQPASAEISTLNVSLAPSGMGSLQGAPNGAQGLEAVQEEPRLTPVPLVAYPSSRPEASADSVPRVATEDPRTEESGSHLVSPAEPQSLSAWVVDATEDDTQSYSHGEAADASSPVAPFQRGPPPNSGSDRRLADQTVNPSPRPVRLPVLAPQTSASGPSSAGELLKQQRTDLSSWHEELGAGVADCDSEPDASNSSPRVAPTGSPCVRAAKRQRTSPEKISINSVRDRSSIQGSILGGRADDASPYRPDQPHSVVPGRVVVAPRVSSPRQEVPSRVTAPALSPEECLRHPLVMSACSFLFDADLAGRDCLLGPMGTAQLAAWGKLASAYTALVMGWERALAGLPVRKGGGGRPSLAQLLEMVRFHLEQGAKALRFMEGKPGTTFLLLLTVLRALSPLVKSLVLIQGPVRREPGPAISQLRETILTLSKRHGSALPLYEVAEYLPLLHPQSEPRTPPPATPPPQHVSRKRPQSIMMADDMPPLEDPPATMPTPPCCPATPGSPGSAHSSTSGAPLPKHPSPVLSTLSSPAAISPAGFARARARLSLVTQRP